MEKISFEEKNLMRRNTGKTNLIQLIPDHLKRVEKPDEEFVECRNKLKNKMKNRLHKEMGKMEDETRMEIGTKRTNKKDSSIEGLHPTDKHPISSQKPQPNRHLKPTVKRNIEAEGDEN